MLLVLESTVTDMWVVGLVVFFFLPLQCLKIFNVLF